MLTDLPVVSDAAPKEMHALHVVFLNVEAAGHVNPTLPLVAELVRRGHTVTYFTEDSHEDLIKSSGALWRPYRVAGQTRTGLLRSLDEAGLAKYTPNGEETGGVMGCQVYDALLVLPLLLEDLKALDPPPSVIVNDPFVGAAPVVAHVLGCPRICFVPYPGPGALSEMVDARLMYEGKPWVEDPRQDIIRDYGVDILAQHMCMEWYSPTMNLVTTIDNFFCPFGNEQQKERLSGYTFQCIGASVDLQIKTVANATVKGADGKIAEGDDDLAELHSAIAEDKKLIYVSLGTIATGANFWNKKFGGFAKDNGIEDMTGKEFCQNVYRACFDVLGEESDIVVLMCVGAQDDALEGLPEKPSNFVIRKAVKQLEVLRQCSGFVTHGGANSLHEALYNGVPLAVIPVFGDQPTNADNVARSGAGMSFRWPKKTLSTQALRAVVKEMLQEDSGLQKGARAIQEKLHSAGGSDAACGAIMNIVAAARAKSSAGVKGFVRSSGASASARAVGGS